MQITGHQINAFLKKKGLNYNILDGRFYEIASIFAPVDNGFYYFAGDTISITTTNSVIICKEGVTNLTNGNILIQLQGQDIQACYYELLQYFFGTQSSGLICKTSQIDPEAKIGKNVQIDPFCVIGKCIIGDNCIIKSHTVLYDNTEIEQDSIIETHSSIGTTGVAWIWDEHQENRIVQPQLGGVRIEQGCFIGAHAVIVRGSLNEYTVVGRNTIIAPSVRLGHGTQLGKFVHFANNVATGGNTIIGDYCFVGCSATFRPKVKVHPQTIVGTGAVVVKNTTAPNLTLVSKVVAKEFSTKEEPFGMPKPKV